MKACCGIEGKVKILAKEICIADTLKRKMLICTMELRHCFRTHRLKLQTISRET